MDIFLVRHGEAAASWGQSSDPGLSDLGVQQATRAARLLLALVEDGTQLVSSPLARARETAEPLAQALGQSIEINEAFREVPSPVPMAQRQDWLRQFMKERWGSQPPALHEWRQRCLAQVLAMRKPTVVFTHFLVLNAIVGQLLGREDILCFLPDNASVTHLSHTGKHLEVVELGPEIQTVVN